jgi:hypothetical protein
MLNLKHILQQIQQINLVLVHQQENFNHLEDKEHHLK